MHGENIISNLAIINSVNEIYFKLSIEIFKNIQKLKKFYRIFKKK